jgi:dolichol-phosphate mannosyltransferase
LARNFGHQAAVTAGVDEARGDAVVIMDADLQDPPAVVHRMLDEYCKGYDVVYGQRLSRQGESLFKRFTAWGFYRFMRRFIHRDLPPDCGDFRLMSRACIDALKSMRETHRFLRGMVAWVGFPQTSVKFERAPRAAGKTKYSLAKMIRFAWVAAISFSPAPLRISLAIGAITVAIGCVYGFYALARVMLGLYVVPGWTSVIILICLMGGGILMGIGILGEYIGRIFEEVKDRPLYIISTRSNAATSRPVVMVDARIARKESPAKELSL